VGQIQLIAEVIIDLTPFMVFFFGWIVLFSIIFRVLGMEIFLDDYAGFNLNMAYFVFTYRNAIGDVNAPAYNYWLIEAEKNPFFAWGIITTIWTFWFLNQIINLIILLNFLISLIGESYGKIMSEKIIHNYNHRAELNQECRLIMQALGFLKPMDFLIVQHDIEETHEEESAWNHLAKNIKTCIR